MGQEWGGGGRGWFRVRGAAFINAALCPCPPLLLPVSERTVMALGCGPELGGPLCHRVLIISVRKSNECRQNLHENNNLNTARDEYCKW